MADTLEVKIKNAVEAALQDLVTLGMACAASFNAYDDKTVDQALSAEFGAPGLYVSMTGSLSRAQMGYWEKTFRVQIKARVRYAEKPGELDFDRVRQDLGAIEAAIEQVMFQDDTWGGLAFKTDYDPRLQAGSDKNADANSEGMLIRTFEVTYHHRPGDPYNAF